MNASVHSQVFTSHEAGGLEIKHGIDDTSSGCFPSEQLREPSLVEFTHFGFTVYTDPVGMLHAKRVVNQFL
jgi:hypothetical protein